MAQGLHPRGSPEGPQDEEGTWNLTVPPLGPRSPVTAADHGCSASGLLAHVAGVGAQAGNSPCLCGWAG